MNQSVYPYSFPEAERTGELDLYRESNRQNIECKNEIEQLLWDSYDGFHLKEGSTQDVIDHFGHDRVQFVLANTILHMAADGRISQANKTWAENQGIIPDKSASIDRRMDYVVNSDPGLVDIFTRAALKEYESLGLLGRNHCEDDTQDYTHRVLVINPKNLSAEYKSPENQLFYAYGGFGCFPDARGRKVMGEFLADGEKTSFYRQDFLGALQAQYLPDWAREKLNSLVSPGDQPEQEAGPKVKLGR